MNIFVVDEDPVVAARALCNKHVVKMVLESAQLLVTAFPAGTTDYKRTHVNHPCAKWTRQSLTNFKWLLVHACELSDEYARRYGRTHASASVIDKFLNLVLEMPDLGLTPFARAIKQPWKEQTAHRSVVDAYRTYYLEDKARFARWAPRAQAPSWWPDAAA
jgi:hypothetical protein